MNWGFTVQPQPRQFQPWVTLDTNSPIFTWDELVGANWQWGESI